MAIALVGAALSAPAMACMCSLDWEGSELEVSELEADASQYEQVFAGLIIWQEMSRRESVQFPGSPGEPQMDPGYWIKSNVLVLSVWRGTPPKVAEVWTRLVTSCDYRPAPGSYFVALVKREEDREVASCGYCDGPYRAYATRGASTLAPGGYALIATLLVLVLIPLAWLFKIVRRKRSSIVRV